MQAITIICPFTFPGRQWGEGLNKPKTQLWRVQLDVRSVLFADHRLPECCDPRLRNSAYHCRGEFGRTVSAALPVQHHPAHHTHTQKFLRSKGFARTMKRRPRNCTSQGSKAPTKPCWYLRKPELFFCCTKRCGPSCRKQSNRQTLQKGSKSTVQ